jgi:hypothetical protein
MPFLKHVANRGKLLKLRDAGSKVAPHRISATKRRHDVASAL